uniref:Uncharacterized protein n=1 Tax=viral metagenome TaxID=1070528 RepID=A0A6C0IY15_9ZZZZ
MVNNITTNDLYKMFFIYNAVLDGWTVKSYNNKFEFIKSKNNIDDNISMDNYIEIFIKNNLKLVT